MKNIFLIIILLFPLKSFAISDYATPKEMLTYYLDPTYKPQVLIYFRGLGSGYSWFHTMLKDKSDLKLFCVNDDKAFSDEELYAVYRNEYLKRKNMYDSISAQPPGFILLRGLISTYPCE